MGRRRDIILTIKNAIEGLAVTVAGEPRRIRTTDTLIDPQSEAFFPIFSITPITETTPVGVMGLTLDSTMIIGLYGYTDGGSQIDYDERGFSDLSEAAENCVQAIKTKLTSSTFLENVACTFSIIEMGPISVEHAEHENPLAYISFPLTVQWVE